MNTQSQSISHHNKVKEWGSSLGRLLYSLCSSACQWLDAQVKSSEKKTLMSLESLKSLKKFNLKQCLSHLVQIGREQTVIKLKGLIQTKKVLVRVIGGILVWVIAFIADDFYSWGWLQNFDAFNKTTRSEWFYENYFYLFLCVGPYLDQLFTLWSMYLILTAFPSARTFFIVAVFLFRPLAKVLWVWNADNDLELQGQPSFMYFGLAIVALFILWKMADVALYIYNHKIRNAAATLNNITDNGKGLPAEKLNEMYATTWNKLRAHI